MGTRGGRLIHHGPSPQRLHPIAQAIGEIHRDDDQMVGALDVRRCNSPPRSESAFRFERLRIGLQLKASELS
jgi:hypothetical protein